MNLEQLKEFLSSDSGKSQEVKSLLRSLYPVSAEDVTVFLGTNDGKAMLESIKDKHLQKGIETWKSNNLESLIGSEIKKRFPQKDEKEIEVERLRSEIEQMKSEKEREQKLARALKFAGDKGLPLELVDFFVGKDNETTESNLTRLSDVISAQVAKGVDTRLKSNSYVPFNGETVTKNLENMSMDEYIKARKKGE